MTYSLVHMKSELTAAQQHAAQLMVENDFRSKAEGGRLSLEEVADNAGIVRKTLYTWRQEPVFASYMKYLSTSHLDAMRSLVDSQLLRLVLGEDSKGVGSIKSLELYYKLSGALVERSLVETRDGNPRETLSHEDFTRSIQDMQDKLARGSE